VVAQDSLTERVLLTKNLRGESRPVRGQSKAADAAEQVDM
jgi:hypothetical protein